MIELSPAPAALPPGRRIYAIGDIHGCARQLDILYVRIAEDLGQRPIGSALLLHIGDYQGRIVSVDDKKSGWFSKSYELLFSDGTHVVFTEVAESE